MADSIIGTPDPIRISHTDIAQWLRCRRLFDWEYGQEYSEPDRLWGPMACGFRVHAAIESFHKTGERPLDAFQRLATIDEKILISSTAPGWALDEFYSDVVVGRNCCTAYSNWMAAEGPYDGYHLMPEVVLEAPILGGRAILIGRVDLLMERTHDGWMCTDDFKTAAVGSRSSLPPTLEKSYQHYVYQVLTALLYPESIIGESYYTILYKTKNPARATHPLIERFRVPGRVSSLKIKLAQLEAIVTDMLEFLDRRMMVDSDHLAYPTPADSCRWCSMRHPCALADENPAGALAMLNDNFRHGPRHARYDRPVTEGDEES
jgi:PD-(D/E)XK nuclease superfamily